MRLQSAVRILASAKGNREVRMDEATAALTALRPEHFPPALRERAKKLLSVRERVRHETDAKVVSFRFNLLKEKEYAALTRDVLSFYEACIFDMSMEIRDIIRPNED